MSDRITMKNLEALRDSINKATNSPLEAYEPLKSGDFKAKANVGHYQLEGAYGGYKLVRITNESGGETNITNGFDPKRILWDKMQAFLSGVEASKN